MIIHLIRPARGTNARSRSCRTVVRRYPRINPESFRGQVGPAALPLFCLAPHGVFRASRITPRAVSSYLTFSPLPALFSKNRRYVFCDTFRRHDLSIAAPAYFTRHVAVWCSDFPPATPKGFGVTSDHLPSTAKLPHKQKSGSRETMNQESRNTGKGFAPQALWSAVGLTPL